jgi:hypothetical protein
MLKGLYGLKQANRQWHKKLDSTMTSFGFTSLEGADYSVYKRTSTSGQSIVVVHTDDMAVATSTPAEVHHIIRDLSSVFEIVDLGDLQWMLGIEIVRDRRNRTISLCQSGYLEKITRRFHLENAAPAYIPLDPHSTLTSHQSPLTDAGIAAMARVPFRALVGSIMYAAVCTRPDIAFAVGKLSRFCSNPGEAHWTAAKQVVRYLHTTRSLRLTLGGNFPSIILSGASDSEFATDVDDRMSVSGYSFSLGTGAISWSSRKQSCIALSSCEAEFVAACNAAREATWLRTLLSQLGFPQTTPTLVYIDNQGTLDVLYNPTSHSRTKHFDLPLLYARRCATVDCSLTFQWLSTHDMTADIFTKALPRPAHMKFTRLLGLA